MADGSPASAVAANPDVLNRIGAAVAASDFRCAHDLAEAEIARGGSHPSLFSARALRLEEQNRFEEALGEYRRARALAPQDATVLNAIGLCLTRLYRLYDAVEAFDEAIRINPTYMMSYHRKGIALGMMGDLDGARRADERALRLDPQNVDALACLASVFARKGDAARTREYAARALKLDSQKPTAIASLAMADNLNREFESAEHRIRALLENPQVGGRGRASALGILGDALDGQGCTEEAFAAYTAENTELEKFHATRFTGRTRIADFAAALAARIRTMPEEAWQPSSEGTDSEGAPVEHVFLLGFFRSGTTLLEQVLESHPDTVTLEERDCLAKPAERYLTSSSGLQTMATLSGQTAAALRTDYWRLVRAHGLEVAGKVMIDKNPLNTLKLPLITMIFPRAKVLLAVRDPRDVVLSCFRRHFEVNAAMFELLTLESAARTYDSVMQMAEQARAKLPLLVHEHRYEDLVGDFDACMHKVCDFIGISWNERMRDFSTTALTQDIRSPSAQQVRRGLYEESVGQWRRYASQLEPVRPLLQPWIERFGYPEK
jgi:Tfp pilus assembly protein PilF